MNYAIVVVGGVAILSLVYHYFPHFGGANWFEGPAYTAENDTKSDEIPG
jgi:hypothetical protein